MLVSKKKQTKKKHLNCNKFSAWISDKLNLQQVFTEKLIRFGRLPILQPLFKLSSTVLLST